ncbi:MULTISPECIES: copper chaperone PCu(A)C [Microbacterium]|uniref:copper chaperone PCu(A)C n=1 Tax=Microbacterium TaxID=33882 RepID=UPI0011EB0FA8|nr:MULTISPECIES: copper chaperone PCu(A)C [Microbacterium]
MNTRTSLPRLGAMIVLSLVALTGCTATTTTTPTSTPAGEVLRIDDAWVKSADEGMSAVFGTLVNDGAEDVTVTSVASAASPMIELHETVQNDAGEMVMREIAGGFVVPAGGGLVLEPGGNHIMMMDLAEPLRAGDEVTFTVTLSDDSTYDFTAPVKDYSGANENYDDGGDDDEGMDH